MRNNKEFVSLISSIPKGITEFHGMPRTGNHAIIFWYLNNITTDLRRVPPVNKKAHRLEKNIWKCDVTNTVYINNVNQHQNFALNILRKFPVLPSRLILSNEYKYNPSLKEEASCLIIRDVANHVCSHYKHFILNTNAILTERYINGYIKNYKKIINTVRTTNIKVANYNKWATDSSYRNLLAKDLNIDNKVDNIDFVPGLGGGSSFTKKEETANREEYNERYKKIKLPEFFAEEICKDQEIYNFNKQTFGINIDDLLGV